MKVLLFSDMHGNKSALDAIKKKSTSVDLIICAGDISVFENDIEPLLETLNKLNKKILIIPGNHETEEDLKVLCEFNKNLIYLHEGIHIIENYIFIGYGGGGFSKTDRGFNLFIEKMKDKISNKNGTKKLILITHQPPFNTKLDYIYGEHTGNKDYTNFIKTYKPIIAVSGHLHENAEMEEQLGSTKLINPGPKGKIITL